MTDGHRFLQYAQDLFSKEEANKITVYILNSYLGWSYSINRYKNLGFIEGELSNQKVSYKFRFRFDDVSKFIRENRSFDRATFNLPPLECDWMDYQLYIGKPDAPIPEYAFGTFLQFAKFALPLPFGPNFPLEPAIDREGAAYQNFQGAIQSNILRLHRKVVETSNTATKLDGIWLNDFRMLINESISIVDVTLHQLYFMAKYRGSEKGWNFDEKALGPRQGVRFADKLSWISKITRDPLSESDLVKNFKRVKELRNHLNHFDPPCFAYTIEDVVGWLNRVPLIGKLLWRIREKCRCQLSQSIVEIMTLPMVVFVPLDPTAPRCPQPMDVGYRSSSW